MSTTTYATTETAHRPAPAPAFAWGTLLVLLAGVFITTLDVFIVNVAIPSAQADLGASTAAIQWVVAGFGLAVGAGLITGGRLGDIYGRRRVYGIGIALFTLASAACALAGSAEFLIAARFLQGGAMALLMPQVLGIITVAFSGAAQVKAFGAYGLAMGFAGVFGQLIGGALVQADLFGLGWRAIFWINVPVGALTLALLPRLVPESRGEGGRRLDTLGMVLVTAGLVAVVLPLIQGPGQDWPLWTWLSLAAAPLLLGVFLVQQRRLAGRGGAPLVDPAMFRERAFTVGLGIALVYALAMGSFFLVLALYLQQGHGMSALDSGLLFIALGAGYFLASSASAKVAQRLGRQVIAVGAVAQAAGYGLLALTADGIGATGPVGLLIPGMVLSGVGMGLALVPMSGIVLAGVGARYAGSAGGVLATAQQVGGALGVAVVGIVFYGVLGDRPLAADFGPAFTWGLGTLIGCCLATAALVQLLPRPARTS
ncbi:MFS transporter [Streptomyces sp. NBC_01304]|uniref:MFS transporter n=1 Tax=Streptomyces sp. NBC_01304 TaxID=2903818 RepID=UPI002E13157F|nr:MFS transporter [Streptomyces sp. NBC_01304]